MERQQKIRDLNKEKLEGILRISKETEEIAQNTCVELKNQGRTIDNIADKSLQVSNNIDKSERIVKGMSSFFGRIKNYFSKPKPAEKIIEPASPKLIQPNVPVKSEEKLRYPEKNAMFQAIDEEDKYLDEIINSVDNINIMARNISETLDYQNKKLDAITDITDRSDARLGKLNVKAKKLLI